MSSVTPVYGWRFQTLGDRPHGPNLGEDLARDVEATVAGLDSDLQSLTAQPRGTYTPTITATGGNPTQGADGFRNGRWIRISRYVIRAKIDIYISGAGSSLGGTSWRVSTPFPADTADWHTAGVLNAASDAVGNFQTYSATSSDAHSGAVLLSDVSELIFYRSGSTSSLGGTNFTTSARLKATYEFVIDPAYLTAAS